MCFRATVRKINMTDRQTDERGALQYLPSRAFGAVGDNKLIFMSPIITTLYLYEHFQFHLANTEIAVVFIGRATDTVLVSLFAPIHRKD